MDMAFGAGMQFNAMTTGESLHHYNMSAAGTELGMTSARGLEHHDMMSSGRGLHSHIDMMSSGGGAHRQTDMMSSSGGLPHRQTDMVSPGRGQQHHSYTMASSRPIGSHPRDVASSRAQSRPSVYRCSVTVHSRIMNNSIESIDDIQQPPAQKRNKPLMFRCTRLRRPVAACFQRKNPCIYRFVAPVMHRATIK